MGIPMYFLLLLLAVILAVAAVIVYLQIYKYNINKALKKDASEKDALHSRMVPPYTVAAILTLILFAMCVFVSYAVGYKTAYREWSWSLEPTDIQGYYAEVLRVGENEITVKGLDVNEEKYRGEFQYQVWEEKPVLCRDETILLKDLEAGDLIMVILITDRYGNTDIFKIQLLND